MKTNEHCKKSLELFNEEGKEYHKWIDSYAEKFGWSHRKILHNKEGIEVGVMIFGEIARKHLQQHVKDDYKFKDYEDIPSIAEIKNDPESYGFIGED